MIESFKESILDPSIFSISLVGMGKNSGKTVTLNFVIDMLKDRRIGVTSIGIDGEKIDNVTFTPKPSISLAEGSIVATASGTLDQFTGSYEILQGTEIFNPLGEILIVKLLEKGDVLIGGPERSTDLKKIILSLKEHGCDKVLVDGAIDRRTSASPYVTDGMVFVTGASFSRDVNRLVKETVHRLNMLNLPRAHERVIKILEDYVTKKEMVLIKGDTVQVLPFKSALLTKEITKYFTKDIDNILYIPGALMDSFMEEMIPLVKQGFKIKIIVKDGTKVFLSSKAYGEFMQLNGNIEVFRKSRALGLAVNPVSIEGYEFDSDALVEKLKHFVNIPVLDPLR